jgi:hypothetical protein
MVLFGDEIVQARLRLEQHGIKRRLSAIARVEIKLFGGRTCGGGVEIELERKDNTAQAGRNERSGSTLTASHQKVAATGVFDGRMERLTGLPCSTQNNPPADYVRIEI